MRDATVFSLAVFSFNESFFCKANFGADGLIWSEIDNLKKFGAGFDIVAFELINDGSNFVLKYFFTHETGFTKANVGFLYV